MQDILRVSADVKLGIGVNAELAANHQRRMQIAQVAPDDVVGFAVEQLGLYPDRMVGGDIARDLQMARVDFRKPGIDDLLVKSFLLLEAKHLAGLFGKHARDAIERHVVVVRIEGGDHVQRHFPFSGQRECGQQSSIGSRRAVDGDRDGAFGDRLRRRFDHQCIDVGPAHHPLADSAQARST